MENIPSDVIREAALKLSTRDVLNFCLSKKGFNNTICNNASFWRNKIKIDYPFQKYSLKNYQENPKKLYMLLTMESKIVELDENEFSDLKFVDETFEEKDIEEEIILAKYITKYITEDFIERTNLKRGDVLHLGWGSEYRNSDKYMWDGEKAVILDYEDDEYGSVPKEFSFPEFRPDYFAKSVVHNNIVRLTKEKVEEAIRNFDIQTQTSYITDRYNKYTIVILDSEIKYSRIFLKKDYLEYDTNENVFQLNVPTIGSQSLGGPKKMVSETVFYPEWKDAIIEIVPENDKTTFSWNGNTLIFTTIY